MTYQVHVVRDEELPDGIKRVLVQRVAEPPLLILAETAAAEWLLPLKRLDPAVLRPDDETLVLHEVADPLAG